MSVCTPTVHENGRGWPSWGSALPGLLLATRCLQSVIFTGGHGAGGVGLIRGVRMRVTPPHALTVRCTAATISSSDGST